MLYSSHPESGQPIAIRSGQGAPVTCASCGCRLTRDGDVWFHFLPLGGRDARGCKVDCADAPHDRLGRVGQIG
jgi:hypothetical protein